MLSRGIAAFALDDDDIGHTTLIEHLIETGSSHPAKEKTRPIPYARWRFVEKKLQRLLALRIIAAPDSGLCPYASPIVALPNEDGGFRMCVDYRHLNKQTMKVQYSLPRIDLNSAHCFLSDDLLMGYQQITVCIEHRPKTALLTQKHHFVFKVMPFGLCNASATFQRLMDGIVREHIEEDIAPYMYELLIDAFQFRAILPVFNMTQGQVIDAGINCRPPSAKSFLQIYIILDM